MDYGTGGQRMNNNKKTGMQFEQRFCKYLAENGWWAHFMTPNASGAQPFDIIAMRDKEVFAIDCKTCADGRFPLSQIRGNQRLAFNEIIWKSANVHCGIAIWHEDEVYFVSYDEIVVAENNGQKSIKLTEREKAYARSCFE